MIDDSLNLFLGVRYGTNVSGGVSSLISTGVALALCPLRMLCAVREFHCRVFIKDLICLEEVGFVRIDVSVVVSMRVF